MKKFFLILILFLGVGIFKIYAQLSESDLQTLKTDTQELESYTQEKPAEEQKPVEKKFFWQKRDVAANKKPPDSFYKFFGKDMSIRGDGRFVYIKAGPSSIVVDSKGRVQIKSAENIFLQSKRSIYLQADQNINMIAGGDIIKSKLDEKGGIKPASEEKPVEKIEEEKVAPAPASAPVQESLPESSPEASPRASPEASPETLKE